MGSSRCQHPGNRSVPPFVKGGLGGFERGMAASCSENPPQPPFCKGGSERLRQSVLITAVDDVGGQKVQPRVSKELQALVYALRDGEVLLAAMPSSCVIGRHPVGN